MNQRHYILMILWLWVALAACNGQDDTPQQEFRVVTGEPEVEAMQSTISALETQNAQRENELVTIRATPSPAPVISQGEVVANEAIILAEPRGESEELGILPQGVVVDVLQITEPNRIGLIFYRIRFEALDGWVASTQISLRETAPTAAPDTALPTDEDAEAPAASRTPSRTPTLRPTHTPTPQASPTVSPTPLPQGFPTPEVYSVTIAEQLFERGRMLWIQPIREVWVLVGDEADPTSGTWECYIDTFVDGMPERDPSLDPEPGTLPDTEFRGAVAAQPVRGFGAIWRESDELREAIGWAIVPETLHTTLYRYDAGGDIVQGEYEAEPGTYTIESFFQETLIFQEALTRAPCSTKGGTWRIPE